MTMQHGSTNVRLQPQEGWRPVPGTAGISQRVSSDESERRLASVDLKVLIPVETLACSVNEY